MEGFSEYVAHDLRLQIWMCAFFQAPDEWHHLYSCSRVEKTLQTLGLQTSQATGGQPNRGFLFLDDPSLF